LPLGGAATDENSGEDFLSLDELERIHIRRVLEGAEGNLSRAAEILGVTRTTLYNKLRKYNPDETPV
jgi:DNA-binding NtrC family response regulator